MRREHTSKQTNYNDIVFVTYETFVHHEGAFMNRRSRLVAFVRHEVERSDNMPLSTMCKFSSENSLTSCEWGDSNPQPSPKEGNILLH